MLDEPRTLRESGKYQYIGIENRWKEDIKRIYSRYDVFQKSKEGSGKYVDIEKSNGMSINDINISDYLKFSTSAKNDLKRNLEVRVYRQWKTYDLDCFG